MEKLIEELPMVFLNYREVLCVYSSYMKDKIDVDKETRHRENKKGQRKPITWNREEIDALKKGVEKYGVGYWQNIINDYKQVFSRNDRRSRDLYKKWNSLNKK